MLDTIINAIIEAGGRPLAVGGCVRDEVLGLEPKDMDIEVHGMSASQLEEVLSHFGKVNAVGVSFGVIKLWAGGQDFDFSLPRRDNKVGVGHKGFDVEILDNPTPTEAAERRDFTWNSMFKDLATGEIIDPFRGRDDLKAKIIRHTSPQFAEDPLRVLRAMQFAGRFNMSIAPSTAILAQDLKGEFSSLPKERIWGEWEKWAAKSVKPSAGLQLLVMTDWITLFPELAALIDCPQDPEWHPEGDVFVHTKHAVDQAARIADRDGLNRVVMVLAALCHDLGKPATTDFKDGKWRSPGHAQHVEPVISFLDRIGAPNSVVDAVVELTQKHMTDVGFSNSKPAVRRLLRGFKHITLDDLLAIIEIDRSARPPLPAKRPAETRWLREVAAEVASQIQPILMGRHLIELGVAPGPGMGKILKVAEEAQMDGLFDNVEDGILWVKAGMLADKWLNK